MTARNWLNSDTGKQPNNLLVGTVRPEPIWGIAKNEPSGESIGYCISSIVDDQVGEIQSIFVKNDYSGMHVGDTLMKLALAWMDSFQIRSKAVYVLFGNSESHSFYSQYGFYPYNVMLRQRDT